jgi:hypothetical protein
VVSGADIAIIWVLCDEAMDQSGDMILGTVVNTRTTVVVVVFRTHLWWLYVYENG